MSEGTTSSTSDDVPPDSTTGQDPETTGDASTTDDPTATTGSVCPTASVGCPCDQGECVQEDLACVDDSCVEIPAGMVFVPGGDFTNGDCNCIDDAPSQPHTIGDLLVDRTELTTEAYAQCVSAGDCTPPGVDAGCNFGVAGHEQHPINCIDVGQANSACIFFGKRLPTEWEWEWAARGGELAHTYAWGNSPEPSCDRAIKRADDGGDDGCGAGSTAPVGSRSPAGDTVHGLQDMQGNASEWTSSTAADEWSSRGGHWGTTNLTQLTTMYRSMVADSPNLRRGVRCVQDPA